MLFTNGVRNPWRELGSRHTTHDWRNSSKATRSRCLPFSLSDFFPPFLTVRGHLWMILISRLDSGLNESCRIVNLTGLERCYSDGGRNFKRFEIEAFISSFKMMSDDGYQFSPESFHSKTFLHMWPSVILHTVREYLGQMSRKMKNCRSETSSWTTFPIYR